MSEVLARIRVRETHGIRRFLYPLTAVVKFPSFVDPAAYGLATPDGMTVPMQLTPKGEDYYRIDFAVSLPPQTESDIFLTPHATPQIVNDPLDVTEDGPYRSVQTHFTIEFGARGAIFAVEYDGITHLRGRSRITFNGEEAEYQGGTGYAEGMSLSAWHISKNSYRQGTQAETRVEITACKSWAEVIHVIEQPKPHNEIVFNLPLAITSPTLTCDFGVGGYVFGKLNEQVVEVVWRTELGEAPYARWSIATAGRTDYVGEVETAEAFLPQRWFHLIDSDKALAVAITKVPPDCQEMTVRLTNEGEVSIAFRLGEIITGTAEFGVCYHFLNDVPAIAAATNPQSILLPPVVEVLAV